MNALVVFRLLAKKPTSDDDLSPMRQAQPCSAAATSFVFGPSSPRVSLIL
jgi:hypothetical protein